MAKRWSRKAKQQVILDAIAAAIPILRLQNWQIEVGFGADTDQKAGCEAFSQYKNASISFDAQRIRIFECVEYAVHELAHVVTWRVAEMLEASAGEDDTAMQKATEAYEELTTEIGHIAVPLVMQSLEAAGKLPPEAKEQPSLIIMPKERRKRRAKLGVDIPPAI